MPRISFKLTPELDRTFQSFWTQVIDMTRHAERRAVYAATRMRRATVSAARTWPWGSERRIWKPSLPIGANGIATQGGAEGFDALDRQLGKIDKGGVLDLAVLAVGFPQQERGAGVAVEDLGDGD